MPIFGELLEKEICATADKLIQAIELAKQSSDSSQSKAISQLGPAYLDLLSVREPAKNCHLWSTPVQAVYFRHRRGEPIQVTVFLDQLAKFAELAEGYFTRFLQIKDTDSIDYLVGHARTGVEFRFSQYFGKDCLPDRWGAAPESHERLAAGCFVRS